MRDVKKSPDAAGAQKQYNPQLDMLKGFTILLVVLGHSIQNYIPPGPTEQNLAFRIIYSFHIPLFMFLAGAVAAYSLRPMNLDFIKRKFYMLVIPFVAWAVVEYLISVGAHHTPFPTYMYHVLRFPDYGLWFLWVLFLNFGVLALAKFLSRWLKLYSYLVVWLAVYSIPFNTYGVGLAKWHFPFFVLGYLIFTYREQLARFKKPILAICIVSSPLLIATWHRLYLPHFLATLEPRLVAHGLQSINIGELSTISTYHIISLAYLYAVPLTTIGLVFWLFQLKPSRYLQGILGFIGLYTIDIYTIVLSTSLIGFYGLGSSWLRIISAFILATVMAMAIGMFVLRRIPILSTIFLGGRTKPLALQPKT